jgi:hypothetical protein
MQRKVTLRAWVPNPKRVHAWLLALIVALAADRVMAQGLLADDEYLAQQPLPSVGSRQPRAVRPQRPNLRSTPRTGQTEPLQRAAGEFQFGQFLTSRRVPLASTPEMFGDSFLRGGTVTIIDSPTIDDNTTLVSDVPLAAATRRTLIAEHNKAQPTDRVYFNYNHFHNSISSEATGTSAVVPFEFRREDSIDQYTLGWETALNCDCWSLEARLPLAGSYSFDFQSPVGPSAAAVDGESFGNLALIAKRVIYRDCRRVVSAGIGIDTPTGSDATATTTNTSLDVENEAVYLLPFLAVQDQPTNRLFLHGFLQVDVPTAGNSFTFESFAPLPLISVSGEYRDQTLLHIDLGGGYWLFRCCDQADAFLTGLAALLEVHYTTTLQDSDIDTASAGIGFPSVSFDLRHILGREDIVNLTAGLHAELMSDTTLRVAAAFPFSEDERFFDAEVLVQLGRRY